MKESEINSLITLLEDPDETVYSLVSREIIRAGNSMVPPLEQAWIRYENPLRQERIETLIHEIRFNHASDEIERWAANPECDLLDGVTLISKYHYPELNTDEFIVKPVERISRQVWLELNEHLTSYEKINVLNHVLFPINQFFPVTERSYAPQYLFLNDVVRTKKANAFSLSILYLIIAQKNNLPVRGINLPGQFALCYVNNPDSTSMNGTGEAGHSIAFYINPLDNGKVFGKNELEMILFQKRMTSRPEYFLPCTNTEFFLRYLGQIRYSYRKIKQEKRWKDVNVLMETLKKSSEKYGIR